MGEINLSNHPSENQVVEALTEIASTAEMKEIGQEKKTLGNDAGASLLGFLNEQPKDLSTLAARVAVVEKDNQDLKEENHRLEGAKAVAQAMRSRKKNRNLIDKIQKIMNSLQLESSKTTRSIILICTGKIQSYGLETLQPTRAQRAKIGIYTRMQSDTILH